MHNLARKDDIEQAYQVRPANFYKSEFERLKCTKGDWYITCCPFHKDSNPSLAVNLETGAFNCFSCNDVSGGSLIGYVMFRDNCDALTAAKILLDGPHETRSTPRVVVTKGPPQPNEKNRERLTKVWTESLPGTHPKAEPLRKYLVNRGLESILTQIPNTLHFSESLEYWEKGNLGAWRCLGSYPAMVSRVDDLNGKPVCIHRTYLTDDGAKAPVDSPKKLMSPVFEGAALPAAVRLYKATDELAITEGIETGLAIRLALNMPVWASVTAGGMAALKIPPTVRKIRIMADLDRSGAGEQAARALTQVLLMEGRDVRIVLPKAPIPEDGKGIDWLDVLKGGSI